MTYQFQHAILGGTFDHFHVGHNKFITTALANSARVTIGLVKNPSSDIKICPTSIKPYTLRKADLRTYLKSIKALSRVKIIPLIDIFGNSLTDLTIDVIYVTHATHHNAEVINNQRTILGLPKLLIQIVEYALGDDNLVVSSGRIRAGLINRLGHSYLKFIQQKPAYHLPETLRQKLHSPIGTVITNPGDLARIITSSPLLIAVGDIVSMDLIKSGYNTSICVIDHRSRRQDINPETTSKYFPISHHIISNPISTINPLFGQLFLGALTNSLKNNKTQVIKVNGEEDLLTLPSLLLSPLNAYVIYGQYNIGMCVVKVTEEIKSIVQNYLEQF